MKRMTAIFLVSVLLLIFSGCTDSPRPSCGDILGALMEREAELPAGKVYRFEAHPTEDGYLPDATLGALYGDIQRESLIDLAVFVPFGKSPCEFAVLLCRDRDTASDVSRALSLRLSAIKRAKKSPQDSITMQMLDSATVTVIGNYVLLIISHDTQAALEIAKSLIR